MGDNISMRALATWIHPINYPATLCRNTLRERVVGYLVTMHQRSSQPLVLAAAPPGAITW